jgi:DsbC/DsbD-like thiol-disulfide interchange protein
MPQHLATLAILTALTTTSSIAGAIEVLTVLPLTTVEVQPGRSTQVSVQVVVKPGYHVQANPVENPSLIPITLKMEPVGSVFVGEPIYPAPKRIRLAGDTQDLVVYDGTFPIALQIRVARNAKEGETLTMKGTLRYQACDARHCLFPATLPVVLGVVIGQR